MRFMKINKILNLIIAFLVLNFLFAFISTISIDIERVLKLLQPKISQEVEEDNSVDEKEEQQQATTTSAITLNPASFDEAYMILNGEETDEPDPAKMPKFTRRNGPVNYHYVTASFGATCYPGGLSNKLFEFVSLIGIARSIRRKAFIISESTCVTTAATELSSYFPRSDMGAGKGNRTMARLLKPITIKNISKDAVKSVPFGDLCCAYSDIRLLKNYPNENYISLTGFYLQSYKYFHTYRRDIIRLLTFVRSDVKMAERVARELFGKDKSYKICVHIRRKDFVTSPMHQHSTEEFVRSSVEHVRDKQKKLRKESIVAMFGDEMKWIKELFHKDDWARIPSNSSGRPTIDYAFFARHCQSIILTASASTFGFWSAYLSSAETVYYNSKFDKDDRMKGHLKPEDFFPPDWIPLLYNESTKTVHELTRKT